MRGGRETWLRLANKSSQSLRDVHVVESWGVTRSTVSRLTSEHPTAPETKPSPNASNPRVDQLHPHASFMPNPPSRLRANAGKLDKIRIDARQSSASGESLREWGLPPRSPLAEAHVAKMV